MSGGGSKPGERRGGRHKGTPNRATGAREAAIAASGVTPLQFLIDQMRDERLDLATRIDAAKSAAPYVHPRLSSVGVGGNADSQPVQVSIIRFADVPTEELPPER
jgi:hypothetical protein